MKPTFFATPQDFRSWLEAHHATQRELLVGFYKRGFGKPSITWPESVDEALSFGWIDGVRKSLSEEAYTIRFTPRKATSIWSSINVARVAALESLGRMTPAGRRAFAARKPERTGVYSFERKDPAHFTPDQERRLRAHAAAARFFDAQPPGYRRTATHWVISAKREETRARRLEQLITDSAEGRLIPPLIRPLGKKLSGDALAARAAARQPVAEKKAARRGGSQEPAGKKAAGKAVARAAAAVKAVSGKAVSGKAAAARKAPAQVSTDKRRKPRPARS